MKLSMKNLLREDCISLANERRAMEKFKTERTRFIQEYHKSNLSDEDVIDIHPSI